MVCSLTACGSSTATSTLGAARSTVSTSERTSSTASAATRNVSAQLPAQLGGHLPTGAACPTATTVTGIIGFPMRQYGNARGGGLFTCTYVPANTNSAPADAPFDVEYSGSTTMPLSQYRQMMLAPGARCDGSPHELTIAGQQVHMTCQLSRESALGPGGFESYLIGSSGALRSGTCRLGFSEGGWAQSMAVSVNHLSGAQSYSADVTPTTLCGWAGKLTAASASS